MILNISGRTDIVNYYAEWLFKRFEEAYVLSRNSLFPTQVRRYELRPEKVDCLIFGSKNYEPVLSRINEITRKFNSYFYYTITAYETDIEPGVPNIDTSINTLKSLSELVGAKRVAWRYDPVLLTKKYTVARHLQTFEYIITQLAGHIDRCIFSFVEMYKKLEYNLPELVSLNLAQMDRLARGFGSIAASYKVPIQTCGPEENYRQYGIETSGCVTLDILGRANDLNFRKLKHRGFRNGCHCIESRDIGAMNSCPNGCKYCYANTNPASACQTYKQHDPDSPLLIGHLKPTDNLQQGVQRTFLDLRKQTQCQLDI
jgi:hypothetical protein